MSGHQDGDVVYRGYRQPIGGSVVVIEAPGGETLGVLKHVPRHSPTGISWGYAGSGAADCALSLLHAAVGAVAKCPACGGSGHVQWNRAADAYTPAPSPAADNDAGTCTSTWEQGGNCTHRAQGLAEALCAHGHTRAGNLCATHLLLTRQALCRECAEGPDPHDCPLTFKGEPPLTTPDEQARGFMELILQGQGDAPPHLMVDCAEPGICPFHDEEVVDCMECNDGTIITPSVYQAFKFEHVARWGDTWTMRRSEIQAWFANHMANQESEI